MATLSCRFSTITSDGFKSKSLAYSGGVYKTVLLGTTSLFSKVFGTSSGIGLVISTSGTSIDSTFVGIACLRSTGCSNLASSIGLGNVASSALSDLASGVTGEIHYVDAGYNKMGMPDPKNIT